MKLDGSKLRSCGEPVNSSYVAEVSGAAFSNDGCSGTPSHWT